MIGKILLITLLVIPCVVCVYCIFFKNEDREENIDPATTDILLDEIALKDAIHVIQDELSESRKKCEDDNQPILFKTERLVLEAGCVFTKSRTENGDVELKLIPTPDIDTGMEYPTQKNVLQKITIEFNTSSAADRDKTLDSITNDRQKKLFPPYL